MPSSIDITFEKHAPFLTHCLPFEFNSHSTPTPLSTMAAPFRLPLLCILFALSAASAAHSAPAPAVDCSTVIFQMADCLSYVSEGGTANKPPGTCCSGLKTVLKSDAECLCEAFRSSAQLGLKLNMTRAVSLPAACHLNAPSISNCGLSLGPSAAPALSPTSIARAPTTGTGVTVASPTPASHGTGSSAQSASIGLLACTSLVSVISAFV